MENEFNTLAPEDFSLVKLASGEQDYNAYKEAARQQRGEVGETPPQQEQQQEEDEDVNFLSEAGAALVGGAADAYESVGGFAELTGDTLKTGLNTIFGRPVDATQNPFDTEYEAGDAGWLDLPDDWIPENKTGLGKLSRGLVEFGLLAVATGGVGKGVSAVSKVGKVVGAWQNYSKGSRALQFVGTGAKIGAEGAVADLVSSSSETENVANLLKEHTPWLLPWFTEALANDPEDNPWLARIKTVTAGAGLNWVGWGLSSFAKGSYRAARDLKAGKTPDVANANGNKVAQQDLDLEREAHQVERNANSKEKAKDGFIGTDPDLTPELEDLTNSATINPSPSKSTKETAKSHVKQLRNDVKTGGDGMTYEPVLTNSAWRAITRGDKNISEYLKDVVDTISQEAFSEKANVLSQKELKEVIIRQTYELTKFLDEGGDIAGKFADYFEKQTKNARVYVNEDNRIVTGSPATKAALQVVINSLAKQAQGIAMGAVQIADDTTVYRQGDMVFEAMRIALKEHKKIGYMWGLDGRQQQVGLVPSSMKKATEEALKKIDEDVDRYTNELLKLKEKGDDRAVADLMELHAVSGGKVTTLDQMQEYFQARIIGGEMDGIKMKGEFRQQVQSTFYNSVLSSVTTPVKAITGTNLIGLLRPFQAYYGATLGKTFQGKAFDQREMFIAAAQIDAIGKAFAEGFQMFKYTWDAGMHNKRLPYDTKFDMERDLRDWKAMAPMVDRYGSDAQKRAYGFLDLVQSFNNNPWVRYSQNAMAAGDSLARTIVGRFEMRMRGAIKAADEAENFDNLIELARKYENDFRSGPDGIFKKNKDGKFIVSDAAARMAGDEAAMTRALEGNMMGFEMIGRIPGMTAFFPFVRTGFNSLDLVFKHTPLEAFRTRYQDIMKGRNLAKYGLTEKTLPQAQALMEGRIAMGSTIMGMATVAALAGNLTGDYPYDKEGRDAWKAAGIKPYSFRFTAPNGSHVYVSYNNIEPFNTLFQMVGNVVQNADLLGESMIDNIMKKLIFMTGAVVVDKSMLSGVEDLATLMSGDSSGQNMARTVARFARSHLPYAGLAGQIGSIMDANQREATDLLQLFVRRDAISRQALPVRYDTLSKDRTGTKSESFDAQHPLLRFFNAFSPLPVSIIENDPIRQGLVEMRYNLPEIMSKIDGVPLNAYEMSMLSKYMQMGNLRRDLNKIMIVDKSWRKGLDAYKKENLRISEGYRLYSAKFYSMVDEAFKRAKKIAIAKMKQEHPELREKIETRKARQADVKLGRYNNQRILEQVRPPVY